MTKLDKDNLVLWSDPARI